MCQRHELLLVIERDLLDVEINNPIFRKRNFYILKNSLIFTFQNIHPREYHGKRNMTTLNRHDSLFGQFSSLKLFENV